MIVDIQHTRAYRIVLVLANAAVAVGAVIAQAGDISSPLAYLPVLIGAFNIVVVAWRQIMDPSTPTLPNAGPAKPPTGA